MQKQKNIWNFKKKRFTKTMAPEMMHAMHLAIEALEKQIPKKTVTNGVIHLCPNCNEVLADIFKHSFCENCGQALDWRDKYDR